MKVFKIVLILIFFIMLNMTISTAINIENQSSSSPKGYIQSLIDQASPGDTINIPSGTYYESIYIDKEISLIGANKEDTIIIGSEDYATVRIDADNVKIKGFTIKNTNEGNGITVYEDNCEINDNILTANYHGVSIAGSTLRIQGGKITNNQIIDNAGHGIFTLYTRDLIITDNNIHSNSVHGLRITYTFTANILRNTITSNGEEGIRFWDSHSNLVDNNVISNNQQSGIFSWSDSTRQTISNNIIDSNGNDGIWFDSPYISGHFVINDNTISNNGRNGLTILASKSNQIYKNEFIENECGIELIGAIGNYINVNNFTGNNYGIFMDKDYDPSSLNNIWYNNFFGNDVQAYDECSNKWASTQTDKGNYWDDYEGKDTNNDGIGDTPHPIPGGSNKDNFPLMEPYSNGHSRVRNRFRLIQNIFNFLLNFNKLIRSRA